MAKDKNKSAASAVDKAAEVPQPVFAVPSGVAVPGAEVDFVMDPLLYLYGSVLSSVDWQRDVRKPITICRQSFKIAKLALEVFETNQKMEIPE